jgi:hypothetical protein
MGNLAYDLGNDFGGPAGVFNNQGTFTKSGGTGTTRECKNVGFLGTNRPQCRAPLDGVTHELRKLVYRRPQLYERLRPVLLQALHPRPEGGHGHEKGIGGLLEGPAACGTKLEDFQALPRRVKGASMGRQTIHACIFDAKLRLEESDLLLQFLHLVPGSGPVCRAGGSRDVSFRRPRP